MFLDLLDGELFELCIHRLCHFATLCLSSVNLLATRKLLLQFRHGCSVVRRSWLRQRRKGKKSSTRALKIRTTLAQQQKRSEQMDTEPNWWTRCDPPMTPLRNAQVPLPHQIYWTSGLAGARDSPLLCGRLWLGTPTYRDGYNTARGRFSRKEASWEKNNVKVG